MNFSVSFILWNLFIWSEISSQKILRFMIFSSKLNSLSRKKLIEQWWKAHKWELIACEETLAKCHKLKCFDLSESTGEGNNPSIMADYFARLCWANAHKPSLNLRRGIGRTVMGFVEAMGKDRKIDTRAKETKRIMRALHCVIRWWYALKREKKTDLTFLYVAGQTVR